MTKESQDMKKKPNELLLESEVAVNKELPLTSTMDLENLEKSNEDEPDNQELILHNSVEEKAENKSVKTRKPKKSAPKKAKSAEEVIPVERQFQYVEEGSATKKTAEHPAPSKEESKPEAETQSESLGQLSGLNPRDLLNALNQRQDTGGPDETDISFMSPTAASRLTKPVNWSSVLLYTVLAFFVIALIWANFASLDEVSRGQGRVIPSGQIKVIDHLEGGIVKDILVKEGDVVDQGQVLLRIDSTAAKSKYDEGLSLYYRTLAEITRLKAQLDKKDYIVPEEVQKGDPDVAASSIETYNATNSQVQNQKLIAEQEVLQKKQELSEVEAKVDELTKAVELTQQEVDLTAPLVKSGVSPKVEWLRLQKDLVNAKGQLETAKVNIPKAKAALLQAQQKYDQVEYNAREEFFKQLADAERRWAEVKDMTTTGLDRLQRTDLKSPVRGIIKVLKVTTIGGAVQAGQDLLEIVPLEDTLLIEAEVSPQDVAFLHPGMPAVIKISAYDFSIYGGLNATLIDISADSIVKPEDKNKEYFRVKLRTEKNHLGSDNNPLPISPGMTAQVDILTGKKTVMQYVLKPILKAKQNALTER